MKITKILATAALTAALAGCMGDTQETSTSPSANQVLQDRALTPEFLAKKGFRTVKYSTSSRTYVLHTKRDRLARADKVITQVTRGKPFSATSAEDAEVQNMLRDAYRALKLCPTGQHPGLINLGYAPFMAGDVPSWSAYIRCSDKFQANI